MLVKTDSLQHIGVGIHEWLHLPLADDLCIKGDRAQSVIEIYSDITPSRSGLAHIKHNAYKERGKTSPILCTRKWEEVNAQEWVKMQTIASTAQKKIALGKFENSMGAWSAFMLQWRHMCSFANTSIFQLTYSDFRGNLGNNCWWCWKCKVSPSSQWSQHSWFMQSTHT